MYCNVKNADVLFTAFPIMLSHHSHVDPVSPCASSDVSFLAGRATTTTVKFVRPHSAFCPPGNFIDALFPVTVS